MPRTANGVEIHNRFGKVISRSKNLAQLRRKVHKELVKQVSIEQVEDFEGRMLVTFDNGDFCETTFGSFELLRSWVRNWRAVYGAQLIVNGEAQGKVSHNNEALFHPPEAINQTVPSVASFRK